MATVCVRDPPGLNPLGNSMSGSPPGPVCGGIVCGTGGLCVVVHVLSLSLFIIDWRQTHGPR